MEVGEVLGRYRVLEAIGRGGMASVYAGEHLVLGHRVAIKVLHPHHSTNPAMEVRFFNEARAISAIEHPGIVGLFDIGRATDGRAYVVMELLRGETLTARLAGGALSLPQVLGFTRQLASALAAAHRHSIVHRDLKPDNVFVVADPDLPMGERIKVLDFGIAKRTAVAPSSANITRTGVLVGTPGFMSPEQCSGAQDVDQRADIYSLGVVLYYMATGMLPFAASTTEELIAEQLYCDPRPASEVNAELPLLLGEVIARCMQKEPEDRYDSMEAVLDALDGLDDEAVEEVTAERGVEALAAELGVETLAAELGVEALAAELAAEAIEAEEVTTERDVEQVLAEPAALAELLEGHATLLDPATTRSRRAQRAWALATAATVVAALSASLAWRTTSHPRPLPAMEATASQELVFEPDEIGEISAPPSNVAASRTASREAASREAASREAASREAAPRSAASREAAPRSAASREAAPRTAPRDTAIAPEPVAAERARPATRARAEPTSRRAPPASRPPPAQRRQRPPPPRRAPEPVPAVERESKEDPFAAVTTPVVF